MKSKYLSRPSKAGDMLREAAQLIASKQCEYSCNAARHPTCGSNALCRVYQDIMSPRQDGELRISDFLPCDVKATQAMQDKARNLRVLALLFAALYIDDLHPQR